MQRRILPQETRDIRIRVSGGGFAVVQIGHEYNLNVTAAWPSFVVNPQVFKPSTANHMQVLFSYLIFHKKFHSAHTCDCSKNLEFFFFFLISKDMLGSKETCYFVNFAKQLITSVD
jgi:hypothetical protein